MTVLDYLLEERRMNRQERQKKMMILADTIKGEINRMCVTDSLAEMDTMADYAITNIEKLQNMRYADLIGERKEE